MDLLEIAVAAPLENTLTYRLPPNLLNTELCQEPLVGRRVLVPLGRRKVTGYVLATGMEDSKEFKIKNISEILDTAPLFPENLIPLFRWISEYYHYPIGEVIKSALPGGLTPKSARQLQAGSASGEKLQDILRGIALGTGEGKDHRDVESYLLKLSQNGKLTSAETKEIFKSKKVKKYIDSLVADGVLEMHESVSGGTSKEKHEICYSLSAEPAGLEGLPGSGKDAISIYRARLNRQNNLSLGVAEAKTMYYLELLRGNSEKGAVPRKELLASYSGAGKQLQSLIASGMVVEERRRVFRSPLGEQLEFFPAPEVLTEEQQAALAEIVPAVEKGGYSPFLLHGVTGSGKTEVYLQATAVTLSLGKSVLVIVPEIALATQLETHFISRFGENVVLLHSGLTAGEKFDQWSLVVSGEARIVIGARSAIFAPFKDLGLIVVDEEHDGGLKQDDKLRYNGRDLAVVRARQQQCTVLLASATPSVVSYYNAQIGKYNLLTMKNRVGNRPLPKVNIIDLRQKARGGKKSIFRPPLQKALVDNLERGKQSVIFINRRGFSVNVICQECGTPVECVDCHVSLTLHRSKQQLLCHYCGYSVHERTVCGNCSSTSMVPVGFGTERVEEELRALVPEARIARLDADTAFDRKVFLETLKKTRAGEIDILVGTQMVAKGHHFPGVTLVGVVWADAGLSIPDYRAAERTFQLVTQVTGRAGRGDDPGEVYIQTMRPDHYALLYARGHRYEELVERELELRRNPKFPPYVRMVAIHIHGESEDRVVDSAMKVAQVCKALLQQPLPGSSTQGSRDANNTLGSAEVLGPAPSPIDRVKKKYRWQVMIKTESLNILHGICNYIHQHQNELAARDCRLLLDVDPENMM
ncbi:replication restart helicase PriA [Desulfosediminicola ganghwensis]|uniref:replication restart helicase PriA n=1 Tax=Desulfosediminicola ganghwensis TaxID=2569540 RepID=UPI0010AC28F8|nr:primosomal protein N' [Desulfosediminicola ganghwensis]